MSEYGVFLGSGEEVRRWQAERENANARLALAQARRCCALLVSQHEPVHSLGIDRERLRVLLDFVQHHDAARLRREVESLLGTAQ